MKLYYLLLSFLFLGTLSVKAQRNQSKSELSRKIAKEVTDMQKALNVPGLSVAVVKGDQVIICRGFGIADIKQNTPFDKTTVGRLASATKFFTSLAVLTEAEKGIINLNDPVKKYLSDAPAEWQEIPVWQLMNLTSGIPGTDKTPFDKMPESEQHQITECGLLVLLKKLPLDHQPGTKWVYGQTSFLIAGMIISEKTGKSWPEILKETVLKLAGMQNTGHNDLTSYPESTAPKNYIYNEQGKLLNSPFFFPAVLSTGAGYNTTAADIAKLFLAINKHKVLSPEIIARYEFNKQYLFPLSDGQYYSIASEIKPFGKYLTIGHSGGPDNANIRYSPEQQIGVAVLANRNTTGISEQLTDRILKFLLLDSSFSAQSQPIGLVIRKIAYKKSFKELVQFYDHAKKTNKYSFINEESDLNIAAYEFIYQKRLNTALKIFRLIVHEFPGSANAYDSLGEAYLQKGNKKMALINYKKSLTLNPENENAKKVIQRISEH